MGGRRRRLNGEIILTPLIDTAWTLLIIFVITSPVLFRGLDIRLPSSTNNTLKREEGKVLSIEKNRSLFLDKEEIEIGGLEGALRSIRKENPDVSLYLRADREVPYGFVVEVMDLIRSAGIEKLGIMTEPRTGGERTVEGREGSEGRQ